MRVSGAVPVESDEAQLRRGAAAGVMPSSPSQREAGLVLHQPARGEGYRVNVDALHLAEFAGARHARHAVDLGAGVGAISLALLAAEAVRSVTLVEIDPRAAELARANLADNGWTDRGEIVCADVVRAARDAERLAARSAVDLVVCNPPYVEPGRGRAPVQPARARARSGALSAFVTAARLFCGRRGRVCVVYPAGELVTLMGTLRAAGLEPKRMRLVHASASRPARIAMVEAKPAKRGGLVIEPPLIERTAPDTAPRGAIRHFTP